MKPFKLYWLPLMLVVGLFAVAVVLKGRKRPEVQAISPDKRFTAYVYKKSNLFSSEFHVEVSDNRSGERITAAIQPLYEGWNSYSPRSLKWSKGSRVFQCLWAIDETAFYGHVKTQNFRIQDKPLRSATVG